MSAPTVDSLMRHEVGQVVNAASAELDEGKTTPPPRYNESSLIADMENASKFAKNAEERAQLRQTEGIGTGRTRGPTLDGLIRRKLLISKKKGKQFELTSSDIARQMMQRLPPWLKDVSTTAQWEMLLGAIEQNQVDPKSVLTQQQATIEVIVERARKQTKS